MQSNNFSRYIPKFLDAQPQFLWWEIDEAMILLASALIGRMVDKTMIFFVIGVGVQQLYTKFKKSKQQGYLQHKLYSLGLTKFKSNLIKKNKIPFYYIKLFVK